MSQKKASQKNKGTVKRSPHFNPENDAKAVHQSLKKSSSPDFAIDITSSRTNAQRQAIKQCYCSLYDKEFENDLKKSDFHHVLAALYRTPTEFDVHCLHKALTGLVTDEKAVIEILLTRSNDEMEKIKELYASKHGKQLEKDIFSKTHGDLRSFLILLNKACRETTFNESEPADKIISEWNAGKKKSGKEEKKLECLCTKSFDGLKKIFEEYEKVTGSDILKTIQKDYSGGYREALLAVVEYSRDPAAYFAERLLKMKNDNATLYRIIISRSEVDLSEIKERMESLHQKSLVKQVESNTSGNLKRLLMQIIKE